MKRISIAVAAALMLAGCQSSQIRMLENSGALRVEPSNRSGSDYVVHIRNVIDFGYNPDDKNVRNRVALDYIRGQCPAGRIVNESSISTGTYGFGRPAITYLIYIRCR